VSRRRKAKLKSPIKSHPSIIGYHADDHRDSEATEMDTIRAFFSAKARMRSSKVYNPNLWLQHLVALHGRPFPKLPILASFVWSCLVICVPDKHVHEWFQVPWQFLALYGFSLSFLLGFRLNVANSRWWEARCLWGRQIAVSWKLMGMVTMHCNDYKLCECAGRWCVAFAIATKVC
jgi:predicted membrane chloride channel (bestrophin family)